MQLTLSQESMPPFEIVQIIPPYLSLNIITVNRIIEKCHLCRPDVNSLINNNNLQMDKGLIHAFLSAVSVLTNRNNYSLAASCSSRTMVPIK